MKCQVVVARYEESLEWTERLPYPIVVYDKGGSPPAGSRRLPNVGFEGQTFLHHFAAYYDELADVTICLQGDPRPHLQGGLKAAFDLIERITPERITYLPLACHASWQHADGSPHHPGLDEANERIWRSLKGFSPPNVWHSWYGGQFAVHRDLVHRHPQAFWESASKLIVTKNDACALERLWGHLLV